MRPLTLLVAGDEPCFRTYWYLLDHMSELGTSGSRRSEDGVTLVLPSGKVVPARLLIPDTMRLVEGTMVSENQSFEEAANSKIEQTRNHMRRLRSLLPEVDGVLMVIESSAATQKRAHLFLAEVRRELERAGVKGGLDQLPFVFVFTERYEPDALPFAQLCARFTAPRVDYEEWFNIAKNHFDSPREPFRPLEALAGLIEGQPPRFSPHQPEAFHYRDHPSYPPPRWCPVSPRDLFAESTAPLTLDGWYEEVIQPRAGVASISLGGKLEISAASAGELRVELDVRPGLYQLDLVERLIVGGTENQGRMPFAARLRHGRRAVTDPVIFYRGSERLSYLLVGPPGPGRLILPQLSFRDSWEARLRGDLISLNVGMWKTSLVWGARDEEGHLVEVGFHGDEGEGFLRRQLTG